MTKRHRFNPTILREYDIRGVVGETVSRDDAEALRTRWADCRDVDVAWEVTAPSTIDCRPMNVAQAP